MKTILHIISSPRGKKSYSHGLSTAIVEKLISKKEAQLMIERNLTKSFPPLMDEMLIPEFYKFPQSDNAKFNNLLNYADTILDEIKAADIIVIGTPLYNLSISASLKAWIDQLIRFGITYGYNKEGTRVGYLSGKQIYLAIASGGKISDKPSTSQFAELYIKEVFSIYTGISDISTFRIDGTAQPNFQPDYSTIISAL